MRGLLVGVIFVLAGCAARTAEQVDGVGDATSYPHIGLSLPATCRCLPAHSLQLRKAEAVVDNDAAWQGGPVAAARRQRMRAITYNNLGCLFKRRNLPQLALQYLQKALALEEAGGPVQNSSSTHLNICAAFSALKRPKEVRPGQIAWQGWRQGNFLNYSRLFSGSVGRYTPAAAPLLILSVQALGHAERAIILLQRDLWGAHFAAPFQDGLGMLVRQLHPPAPAAGAAAAAAAGAAAASATATRHLLASANLLAMAYHNAGVEHEKLGRLREALVSFTRCASLAHAAAHAVLAMRDSRDYSPPAQSLAVRQGYHPSLSPDQPHIPISHGIPSLQGLPDCQQVPGAQGPDDRRPQPRPQGLPAAPGPAPAHR
jgi:tetratricopeptide (TPR) repeat protein